VKAARLKRKLLGGIVTNGRFEDACRLATYCGWALTRTGGSHHIFTHALDGVPTLNLQAKNGEAKPYQMRQMKDAIESHNL
jgi:predicted RNA binding protein YcfA (HicA-like mRNA interferase family)